MGALIVVVGIGCADLPEISAGVCGNGVVEANEDCDGFADDPAAVCLPRGATGECHFDCRPFAGGARPACPAGWGCDGRSICQPPTGAYAVLPDVNAGGAFSLLAGDFDGDGRADVLSAEPVDVRGRAKFGFRFFDGNGALVESRMFPKTVASPVIADVSGDGRSDFTFSNFSVGLLLGHADRSLVPETFSSYHFPDADVRLLIVNDAPIEDISAVVAATSIEGVEGLYVPELTTGVLRKRCELPGPAGELLWNTPGGDIIVDPLSSPCQDLVLAARGGTSLSVVNSCQRTDAAAFVTWRDPFLVTDVPLDPPAEIDAAPQVLDLNGDHHLDVLVGAGGRAYVAYGDGHALAPAVPYRVPLANPDVITPDIPMPLAAGDFTGDGFVDFVFPNFLVVSIPPLPGALPAYLPDRPNDGLPWTEARVADLNGDGKLDVIAASTLRLGLDFFNGTGTPRLNAFSIPTDRPVPYLAVGDMDGDLIDDVSFVESRSAADGRDTVMVAFGAPAGAPEMPVPVARVEQIEDLSCLPELGLGNLLVASTEIAGGVTSGVLAVLGGSGDRLPFAPYQLVSVTADRSVNQAAALAVQIGAFLGPGRHDLLALTSNGQPNMHDFKFWLLPNFGASHNTAVPLDAGIDDRLQAGLVDGLFVKVNLAAAAADLDGDGIDENVWAMPADGGVACGVLTTGLVGSAAAIAAPGGTAPALVTRGVVVVPEACGNPSLLSADADGDGRPEIVLLTGTAGGAGRKLILLWNDGSGGFDAAHTTVLNAADESPQQVTALPATALRKFAFAYVTPEAAVLREATDTPRLLAPARMLTSLSNGSGIVAADVNGDGVIDLTVASSGSLRVLRAELRAP